MSEDIMEKCQKCDSEVYEVCQDGYCRDCHVSLSFESCVDGSWVREIRAAAGLPEGT